MYVYRVSSKGDSGRDKNGKKIHPVYVTDLESVTHKLNEGAQAIKIYYR
jgi:hypothetical protein